MNTMKTPYLAILLSSLRIFAQGLDSRNEYPLTDCEITLGAINCTCTNRQNVVIKSIDDKMINAVEIHHCGYVTIHSSAFFGLSLEYLILDDLLALEIHSLMLTGVRSLDSLEILNIGSLKADQFALQIDNARNIMIRNVTTKYLPQHFFKAYNVTVIVITGCELGVIYKRALVLEKTEIFYLLNSKGLKTDSSSILLIGYATSAYIQNTSFVFTKTSSFYFEDLKVLNIQNCSFQKLNLGFIRGNVQQFNFLYNVVSTAENGCFLDLNVTSFVIFKNNTFKVAENGALNTLSKSSVDVTVENNTFTCNCDLEWIWEKELQLLHDTSFCEFNEGMSTPIRDMNILLSNDSKCSAIVLKDKEERNVQNNQSTSEACNIMIVFIGVLILLILK